MSGVVAAVNDSMLQTCSPNKNNDVSSSTRLEGRSGEMVMSSGLSNAALNPASEPFPTVFPTTSSTSSTTTKTSGDLATYISCGIQISNCRPPPPDFYLPPAKRFRYNDWTVAENKPSDAVEVRAELVKWKRYKMDLVNHSYNAHRAEYFFLKHGGNLMEMNNWLKKPSAELFEYLKENSLDDSVPKVGLLDSRQSGSVASSSGVTSGEEQQDQMVEKARHEANVVARIAQLRKEGLWTEKRLPKVHEPARPKCHWDYLLEEMVWLSADFAQERKWKKAAAKKCAKMVQKYFQDKELAAERAQKEEEMKLRRIASFMAREVRTFWNNIEKLVHFKMNSKHEEKKKRALDQQLSFIVDQTEKFSGMLAESMKKPTDSSAVSTRSETPSIGSLSDEEFQPSGNSTDDEETIMKEDDDPHQQATEVKLLQQESSQTLDDVLASLPPEYLACLRGQDEEAVNREKEADVVDNKNTTEDSSMSSCVMRSGRKRSRSSTASQNESNFSVKLLGVNTSHSSVVNHSSISSFVNIEASSSAVTKSVANDKVQAMEVEEDAGDDLEYEAVHESDDEVTLAEQEKHEGKVDHAEEIRQLQADNELSVEELRQKYASMPVLESAISTPKDSDEEDEALDSDDDSSDGETDADQSENQSMRCVASDSDGIDSDQSDSDTDGDEEDGVGLKSLMDESMDIRGADSTAAADQQLEEATAVAEALQPKGFTLSSAVVTTAVPFLLKHSLREYQHVGLDWLRTMYDKGLNGILADEMGLGKTIQTIALLAHLACENGSWGPHLIVVPTSVMLNWEMELKKWCPAFKILTYFGTQKERKAKRTGWTKRNAFHICITSYKLVIQDHQSFRRKKWKYFILDEAQNIKNFKSKRWQLLLNFQSDRRLLLTGTPLQNNLMELWSLMHFLMPHVFASHREFKEWFSNPVTGMIQGSSEYNDNIIKRLHKVLRPFILRRLKTEVEQQMPKKYEHVVMCRLSKRQRFLYEEFMSRTKTKETLATGNFLSVINILMQLRKVCNHPNLFEERPTVSPFMMEALNVTVPSCCYGIVSYNPFKHIDLGSLNLLLCDLEISLTAFASHRIRGFMCAPRIITEIDSAPPPPPRCPPGKIRLVVRQTNRPSGPATTSSFPQARPGARPPAPAVCVPGSSTATAAGLRYQLVQQQQQQQVKAQAVAARANTPLLQQPRPTTLATQTTPAKPQVGGLAAPQLTGLQVMHTPSGQLLLTTAPRPQQQQVVAQQGTVSTNTLFQKLQTIQGIKRLQGSVITMGPVLRLPPPSGATTSAAASGVRAATPSSIAAVLQNAVQQQQVARSAGTSASATPINTPQATPHVTPQPTPLPSPTPASPSRGEAQSPARVTRSASREWKGTPEKSKDEDDAKKKCVFYLPDLEELRLEQRKHKLALLARLNCRKCRAIPLYGGDLVDAVTMLEPPVSQLPHRSWLKPCAINLFVMSGEERLHDLQTLLSQFTFCVPAVVAPCARLTLHHPDASLIHRVELLEKDVHDKFLKPLSTSLHSVTNASITQFPDARLIQYDCGKLQTLDKLLRQLKAGDHRVLIFTQMTRMLDVLEAFLNYHGHIYLRLDGTTRVQDRQMLMERFNQDKRIFVFILSTRSGGIGVNLTGADTVIFYDSDWNPTMDAQAQDRCHRIGQTRDVHIYRLISEKSVEENILKKANQKRMLGNLAIEGGNFTTAYFREQTIQELFKVCSEQDAAHRMAELLEKPSTSESSSSGDADSGDSRDAESLTLRAGALENALAAAEDETDVVAARHAMAEAAADLAEFDENIPLSDDTRQSAGTKEEEPSKVQQEINKLMEQLTGVERYAMLVLENADERIANEQQRLEQELETQKREWELDRQRTLLSNQQMMASAGKTASEDDHLTFNSSQLWLPIVPGQSSNAPVLGVWLPPTPPRSLGDKYIEAFSPGYETLPMPERALPAVFKTERHKRLKLVHPGSDAATRQLQTEELENIPPSMFDLPPAYLNSQPFKIRRDFKLHKFRSLPRGAIQLNFRSGVMTPTVGTIKHSDDPWNEWFADEDTVLISLATAMLSSVGSGNGNSLFNSHTINYDFISDTLNRFSKSYRNLKSCRLRHETLSSSGTFMSTRQDGAHCSRAEKHIPRATKSGRGAVSNPGAGLDNEHFFEDSKNRLSTLIKLRQQRGNVNRHMLMTSQSGQPRNPAYAHALTKAGISWDSPMSPINAANLRTERLKERYQREYQTRQNYQAQQQILQQQQQQQLLQQQQQQQQQQQLQQPQSVSGSAAQIASAVVSAVTAGGLIPQQQATQQLQHIVPATSGSIVQSQQIIGSVVMSNKQPPNSIVVSSDAAAFMTVSNQQQQVNSGVVSAVVTSAGPQTVVGTVVATSVQGLIPVAPGGSASTVAAAPASGSSVSAAATILTGTWANTSSSNAAVRTIAAVSAAPVPAQQVQAAAAVRTTAKLSLQELQPSAGVATVVSMASLAQLQAANKLPQPIQVTGIQTRAVPRPLTQNQLTYIRQAQALQQTIQLQQQQKQEGVASGIKRLQIGTTAAGQKVAVSASGLHGIAAIQVSQAGRAQLLKHPGAAVVSVSSTSGTATLIPQGSAASPVVGPSSVAKTITRTVTEADLALLRRQQQSKTSQMTQVGNVVFSSGGAAVVTSGGATAVLKAAGAAIPAAGASPCAGPTGVTVTLPQQTAVRAATAQQAKHLATVAAGQQITVGKPQQQRTAGGATVLKSATAAVGLQLAAASKAGGAPGTGLGTLQIIQSSPGQKGTMQQIQVIKQGGAVLATSKGVAASGVSGAKLLSAAVNPQSLKQAIQVVSAGGASTMRVSSATGSPTLTLPAAAVRMATPQLLSQVSAALQQGQTLTVPVRATAAAGAGSIAASGAAGQTAGVRVGQPITLQAQQLTVQQLQPSASQNPTTTT